MLHGLLHFLVNDIFPSLVLRQEGGDRPVRLMVHRRCRRGLTFKGSRQLLLLLL